MRDPRTARSSYWWWHWTWSRVQAPCPRPAHFPEHHRSKRTCFQSLHTVGHLLVMVQFTLNLICFFHSSFYLEEKEPGHGKVNPCEQVFGYWVDIQEIFLDQKLGFYCEGECNPNSHTVSLDLQIQKEGKRMDTDLGTRKLLDLTKLSGLLACAFFFLGETENQSILSWLESELAMTNTWASTLKSNILAMARSPSASEMFHYVLPSLLKVQRRTIHFIKILCIRVWKYWWISG